MPCATRRVHRLIEISLAFSFSFFSSFSRTDTVYCTFFSSLISLSSALPSFFSLHLIFSCIISVSIISQNRKFHFPPIYTCTALFSFAIVCLPLFLSCFRIYPYTYIYVCAIDEDFSLCTRCLILLFSFLAYPFYRGIHTLPFLLLLMPIYDFRTPYPTFKPCNFWYIRVFLLSCNVFFLFKYDFYPVLSCFSRERIFYVVFFFFYFLLPLSYSKHRISFNGFFVATVYSLCLFFFFFCGIFLYIGDEGDSKSFV